MTAFVHHFAFEFRTGIRNKNLLLMNYLFPLSLYLMMSLIMPGVNPLFRDTIIPSMTCFGMLAATLLGLPDPLVTARETGIFRSYKINGVPALNILLIPALSTILHVVVVALVIMVTAPVLFSAPLPVNVPLFLLIVLATAVALSGLSVLIGVLAPNTRLTVLYSQALFLPSMIIGGIMLPYSMLPDAAGRIALLLPATHAMNAFNGLAMGGVAAFQPWGSLLTLVIGGLVAFLLALYLFRWDSRNVEQRRHPALGVLALLPYAIWMLVI
ncbi:MAG: ABC transporter permease [Caldilineaceae bacterium]|nr:ABC transporter permease [Caldilineaceae bacterium]